jgi:lysylphosphatidylglycerol synthetase-like protein (DUF2156 family)
VPIRTAGRHRDEQEHQKMTNAATLRESVLDAIQNYPESDNPSAFLAVNDGNSYFAVPGFPGAIVYRTVGDYLVQFGGAFAPDESYAELLDAFLGFAKSQNRTIVSVQLQRRDAMRYALRGFTVNQVGASYAVDLANFTLAGTRFMQLRNKISRALHAGLVVAEVAAADWYDAMREVDRTWLAAKGAHAKPLEFLVGQYGGEMQRHRRLFVGTIDGKLAGYISYSPVYGARAGWMHDLSRRVPGDRPGIMEAINKAAIDKFRAESVPWLHFGFTPFTGLDAGLEIAGHSPGFNWFMHFLAEYGGDVYPAATQLAYKQKWAPSAIIPEYVAFAGRASLHGFIHVFRAANAL